MNWIEVIGYCASGLTVAAYSMKTMIPLRIAGIGSNIAFILYGTLAEVYPVLIPHLILLPLNILRLIEVLRLVHQVRHAADTDLSIEWLKPYMRRSHIKAGDVLFTAGDPAGHMYYIASGRLRVEGINKTVNAGELVGEIGLITETNQRTYTVRCLEDADLMVVSYLSLEQLLFQNPKFAVYFNRLIGRRLLENMQEAQVARMEDR